jgi:hypothetical protein
MIPYVLGLCIIASAVWLDGTVSHWAIKENNASHLAWWILTLVMTVSWCVLYQISH